MPEERKALFVRLPAAQVDGIDAAARSVGSTKQDFVAAVLAASLDQAATTSPGAPALPALPTPAGWSRASGADEVLTVDEVAELLEVAREAVMARVVAGDLPGRRLGDQWRFSRAAVLGWLDGSDADRQGAGFRSKKQAPRAPSTPSILRGGS